MDNDWVYNAKDVCWAANRYSSGRIIDTMVNVTLDKIAMTIMVSTMVNPLTRHSLTIIDPDTHPIAAGGLIFT